MRLVRYLQLFVTATLIEVEIGRKKSIRVSWEVDKRLMGILSGTIIYHNDAMFDIHIQYLPNVHTS